MGLAQKLHETTVETEIENEKITLTREKVENTLTEELIIGICSPIGSSKEAVVSEIEQQLQNNYGYIVKIIKMSTYIDKNGDKFEQTKQGQTNEYTNLMNKIIGGNSLRHRYNPAILAELAVSEINIERMATDDNKIKNTEDLKSRRICYIIDSLKNIEELILLRSIYKDIFYMFSIFSPEKEREGNLRDKGLSNNEIKTLVETDEYEKNEDGQNVRNIFIDADFFFRVSNSNTSEISNKVIRYLNLIFESEIVTPNSHEIAMYEAKSASGNSSCLSRQVGAAIANTNGEIISRGWNDVPKCGGNLYHDEDKKFDNRCLKKGFCSNDNKKDELTDNILDIILKDDFVNNMFLGMDSNEKDIIIDRLRKDIRKSTKVKDLIEFSRAVHAEMHAIIMGSQLSGNQMKGGKLYCTTYPCHNCGRHIVVSGIHEIYYIEPYVKSLCIDLHDDAMTEDESEEKKVKILMYDGVAPRRFLEFFSMKSSRKDKDGKKIKVGFKSLKPKNSISLQALSTLETQALHSLNKYGLNKLKYEN